MMWKQTTVPGKLNLFKWENNYFLFGAYYSAGYSTGYKEGFEAAYEPVKKIETEDLESNEVSDLTEVKRQVKQYFEEHDGETIDYVDLTEAFEFPLALLVQACKELELEGKIAGVD